MPYEASSYYEKLVFIVRGLLNVDPEKRLTSGAIVNQCESKTILKNILPPIERNELIKKNSTKHTTIATIQESRPHSA